MRMLASVRSYDEAVFAADHGADIIDLKEPRTGALGAVSLPVQEEVVMAMRSCGIPVSATVGDLPMSASRLHAAIEWTALSGVDFVKFGVMGTGARAVQVLSELDRLRRGFHSTCNLVAVLFADRVADCNEAIHLARCALSVRGVKGVMLDTAGKTAGDLIDAMSMRDLTEFVDAVQEAGGFAGLAGSLREDHVPLLAATRADLLGFRGAICGGNRNNCLESAAFLRVRDQMSKARVQQQKRMLPPAHIRRTDDVRESSTGRI